MLAPLSLRICCFAVMAPALTEAATQAQQSFKLPPSPASSSSNSNPPSPLGTTTEKCLHNEITTLSNGLDKNKAILINSIGRPAKNSRVPISSIHIETDERVEFGGKYFNRSLDNKMNKSDVTSQPINMGIQQASAKISALETHPKLEMDVPNVKDVMDVDTPASSPYSSSLDNSLSEIVRKCDEKPPTTTAQAATVAPFSSVSLTKCQTVKPTLNTNNQSTTDPGDQNVKSIEESVQLSSAKVCLVEKKTERLLQRLLKLQLKQAGIHLNDQVLAFITHHQQNLRMSCPHKCNDTPSVSSADLLQSEEMKNMSTAELVNLVRKMEAKNCMSLFKNKPNHSSVVNMSNSNMLNTSNENSSDHIGIKSEKVCVHTEKNSKLSTEKCREIKRVSCTISRNLRILESAIDSDATDSSSGGESCDELDGYLDREKTPLKTLPIHRRAAWKWAVDRGAVASKWTWLQAQISDLEYRIRKHTDLYKRLRSSKSIVNLKETFSSDYVKSEKYPDNALNKDISNERFGKIEDVVNSINNVHNNSRLTESVSPNLHGQEMLEFTSKNLKTIDVNKVNDPTCVASRVRPLIEGFKKRRLLRTSDIYSLNPKIAKSNYIRCGCLPYNHCVMCGGQNSFSPTYESENLSASIANVDPGYHSVLSFKQDISLPVRFEKLLKGGEWQKVNSKSQPLLKKKSSLTLNNHAKNHSDKRTKSAAAQLLSSAKMRRKKLTEKKHPRASLPPKNGTNIRNNKTAVQISLAALKRQHFKLEKNHFAPSSANSSKAGSPVPSPLPGDLNLQGSTFKLQNALLNSNSLTDAARKRRDSAYDIDNIVIPYSMTASTRIEKLQYKEILTPKWRLLDDNQTQIEPVTTKEETLNICKNNGIIIPIEEKQPSLEVEDKKICVEEIDDSSKIDEDNEVEDIADDAFMARHSICETLEKKRFLGIVNQPSGRSRSRGSRLDSRADSSGCNTPDPLSPHSVDHNLTDHSSPINSPTTPLNQPEDFVQASTIAFSGINPALVRIPERKRIMPSGKDLGSMRTVNESVVAPLELSNDSLPPVVIPFESRTFPLSDEDYDELLQISSQVQKPVIVSPEELRKSATNIALAPSTEMDTSRPVTPEFPSSTSESIVDEPEDPNDPEWTVIANERAIPRQSSLVLKLTKR